MGCGWRANVLDLLGTVLTERLGCAPPDPDRAHRALMLQITSFIEEHLGEADLAPAQIAAAHHLASDESSFVAGATLTVDGGMSI
jgi:NAD(P)-dependent dehydrogenase (short-subunit alcohol dehydrogenase family)